MCQIYSKFKSISNDKTIIDKMPSNFFWIGFIKIFLPNVKMIHITRNIKDNCLSIYRNLFDQNSLGWTYDQNDIVLYVNLYRDLMKLWKKKLPNFIYDVKYENLVNDQLDETRKIIDFCDLEWENSCIDFFKTSVPVKTASIIQVRKPIYKTSINQSKNYSQYLNLFDQLDN